MARIQVQGISEEDYDRIYLAGYQDGIEQAKYVSDYEVAEVTFRRQYDSHDADIVTVYWHGDSDVTLITKAALESILADSDKDVVNYFWAYRS